MVISALKTVLYFLWCLVGVFIYLAFMWKLIVYGGPFVVTFLDLK